MKKVKHIIKKVPVIKVGEAVTFFDELGQRHDALVTLIGAPDSVHVVYIDENGKTKEVHSVSYDATDDNKAHYEKL